MRKRRFIAFLSCCLLWACSPEDVIPEKVMAKIYRDIYLTDQYINTDLKTKQAADSLNVYASICAKYGYTTDDFVRSVDYYLQSPADFADILKPAYAELKKKENELEKEIARLDNLNVRWTLLDTLPKMADRRILGNGYYRALYQLFYHPDTLVYLAPQPDTAKLNATWSSLLLYPTSVRNVPGRVPYLFGAEWLEMDPELVNNPLRWNYRKTLPQWFIRERDAKDSIKVIQDSLKRKRDREKQIQDSINREKRMKEMEEMRKKRNPKSKPDPKNSSLFQPAHNQKKNVTEGNRHTLPKVLPPPTQPPKK